MGSRPLAVFNAVAGLNYHTWQLPQLLVHWYLQIQYLWTGTTSVWRKEAWLVFSAGVFELLVRLLAGLASGVGFLVVI